jgi:LPS-assembly protein
MAIRCHRLDRAGRAALQGPGVEARVRLSGVLPSRMRRLSTFALPVVFALVLALPGALPGFGASALAQDAPRQTLNDRFAGSNAGDKTTPMVVEANNVVYDDKAHTVTAEGDAQIYYKGKVLEADRVIYFRETGRVLAEGSVKLTETDGSVTHADKMELSGDFKQGFVDTLRSDSKERTHMGATRSEKIDADTTVFRRGTYTACPSCAEHPDRAPIWRLRAEKITHKNEEQMLYYENAWFELYGVPIAYIPFMSAADPSVTRQSGFLTPKFTYRSLTGFGVGEPYFYVIAPNMDVTLTPSYLSRQGFLGDIDFRHRLENGYYNIELTGIHQQDTAVFAPEPYGAGSRVNRGEVQSQGAIWLSPFWKFGWDIARVSDKWFPNDYGVPGTTFTGNVFRETSSTVYLNGQGDRGYFDLRGFMFQGTANTDLQRELPVVAPILDYNKTVDLAPEKTFGIGGQVEIDANFTHSSAALATYQQIGIPTFERQYGLFPVCRNAAGQPDYNQQNCLLRGIGGDYTSGTIQLSWQRKFIDPLGEVWAPFAFARANGNFLNYSNSGSATFGPDTISNAYQTASGQNGFLSENNQFGGYVTPGVGVEWRYPLLAKTPIGSLVIEPIAQVIARPDGQPANTMVNLDAQSLVFDDSNLFEWNKYSGYDRFETGVRANYGAQFTLDMNRNGYVNAIFGQSTQLAGANAYATPDAANVGLSSGLDTKLSDYVSRISYTPNSNYTFVTKARFDQSTLALRRLDAAAQANYGPLHFGAQFANYQQQPLIGYDFRREGLQFDTRWEFIEHYSVSGNINFDLGRHYYNALLAQPAPALFVAGFGAGLGYSDDCTRLMLNYSNAISDVYGYPAAYTRNQTVLLTLDLRTLGDLKAPIALSPSQIQDGIRTN